MSVAGRVRRLRVALMGVAALATTLTGLGATALEAPPAAAVTVAPTAMTSIASGSYHSCGITQVGGLKCWGGNMWGETGTNPWQPLQPTDVIGLTSGVGGVAAGGEHTCAVTTAGAALCWGYGGEGELGGGNRFDRSQPGAVSGLQADVVQVSAGAQHSCAVLVDGTVRCWGANTVGQLGTGSTSARSLVPVPVTGLSGVVAIDSGSYFNCALLGDGTVRCWGGGTAGSLGNGASLSSSTPVPVTGLTGVTAISGGGGQACAVSTGGALSCWGVGTGGQLGNGGTTSSNVPVAVTGLSSGVATVEAGQGQSCAVATTGAAWCWGGNTYGQLGNGTSDRSLVPTPVIGLSNATAIAGGIDHACALTTAGVAKCWGRNENMRYQLGHPRLAPYEATPVVMPGVSGATSVSMGGDHGCAMGASAGVTCWGRNNVAQLGGGSTVAFSTDPVAVTGLGSGVASIDAGTNHTCAVTTTGGVTCWGANLYGQVGSGSTGASSPPVPVSGLPSAVASVSAGHEHSCAVTTGGAALCWGRNVSGQVGNGASSHTPVTAPTPVPTLTSGVAAVVAGYIHSCALSTAGGVSCWGANNTRQLGTGTTTASTTPVPVNGLSSGVVAITALGFHTCALTTTGGVVCWGQNSSGEAGTGSSAASVDPAPVSGLSSGVATVTAGFSNTCATLTSGGVRCWGSSIGNGAGGSTSSNVPVAPVGVADAVEVSFGSSACARMADGSLRCWGFSHYGQLGVTPAFYAAKPVDGNTVFFVPTPAAPTISGERSPAANAEGWNNEPVTVSFTCASAALASCTAPVTVSTDGSGQSVIGTATDTFGQSATATVSGINIDRVAPTLAGVAATAPNGAGWYDAPVTMVWTCDDALSGVAPGACPASSETVGEGESVSVPGTVSDRAGNVTNASSEAVKVDLTAPSTGVSSAPEWSAGAVTLTLSPVDGLSGVASTSYVIDDGPTQTGTAPVVSGDGVHTVEFWSTDVAGNVEAAQTVQVSIATDGPLISGGQDPEPNAAGWSNGPVTVSFTCTGRTAGLVSCTEPQAFTTEVDTTVTGTAVDAAGNEATAMVTVRIDLTAPTVTAQVPAANANGWFNAPVQVPFSCSDTGGSGVASCPAPVTVAGEGADQAVGGQATDNAGNVGTSAPATVSLDATAPTISGAVVEPMNGNGGWTTRATVRWTCTDALSGVAACPADQVITGDGVHVVSQSVTDRAGNTGTAEVTVRIDRDTSNDPATVHGVLTDAGTGQPVAGATVYLRQTGSPLLSTQSGTNGAYTFPIVGNGSWVLQATKSGVHLPTYHPGTTAQAQATPITVGLGSNVTASFAMVPGHTLTGVLTAPGGAPVSGATVKVEGGGASATVVSDATGRYSFAGMLPGARTVTVSAYGYAVDTTPVTLPATTVLDRTLTAAAGGHGLKGTVRALTGSTPLAGATVRVWVKGAATFAATATTGADGRYSLPNLPVGSYEVDVVRGDYRVRWWADSASRAGASTLTVAGSCTTAPDTTFGDPCAAVANVTLRLPSQ